MVRKLFFKTKIECSSYLHTFKTDFPAELSAALRLKNTALFLIALKVGDLYLSKQSEKRAEKLSKINYKTVGKTVLCIICVLSGMLQICFLDNITDQFIKNMFFKSFKLYA